ncbi:MAG: riboflavin synthase, partial [bacterium]
HRGACHIQRGGPLMFTGLVEEVGKVRSLSPRGDSAVLAIEAKAVLDDLKIGDSINVSGACQTVVAFDSHIFTVEAVRETLQRTRFGELRPGDPVNLERAMRPTDRLGGHLVQGHVDGMIRLLSVSELQDSRRLRFELPQENAAFVVEKGSIAIDGVSLTVARLGNGWFEVEIIPHTLAKTTLSSGKPGDRLHVEWDLIAKYVARMLNPHVRGEGVTLEKLIEAGFGLSDT